MKLTKFIIFDNVHSNNPSIFMNFKLIRLILTATFKLYIVYNEIHNWVVEFEQVNFRFENFYSRCISPLKREDF